MKTLIIIPTKNRVDAINCLLVNLASQSGTFDVFIVDQSTEDDYLLSNRYFSGGRKRLEYNGHKCELIRSLIGNQHNSCNIGVQYAKDNGYELCFCTDDDIIYEDGYIEKGIEYMNNNRSCGVLTGYTLCPEMTIAEQTMDEFMRNHKDFSGKIEDMGRSGYEHCIFVNPTLKAPQEYETLFGPFFFRTEDAISVGGFPTHLSKYGNRGEIILKIAIGFLGKKLILEPSMVAWHYSNPSGGLRTIDGEFKKICIEEDFKKFDEFIKRRTPHTGEL
jgi:glycosyltransferase involved in cell wall biosynthesis